MSPDSNEIHLWQLQQSDFELGALGDFEAWLTEQERQRYRRFQFDRHRRQLLLGRILLRSVLSRYCHALSPPQWTFVYNEQGKPALAPGQLDEPLFFNLSHSQDRIVMAVSSHEFVGIDIEYNRRPRRVSQLVQRFFSGVEGRELMLLPEPDQLQRFYLLWTLKESYIKARGLGLALALDSFSFTFPKSGRIEFAVHEDSGSAGQSNWHFLQLDCGEDYSCAVAVDCKEETAVPQVSAWRMAADKDFLVSTTAIFASS